MGHIHKNLSHVDGVTCEEAVDNSEVRCRVFNNRLLVIFISSNASCASEEGKTFALWKNGRGRSRT